MNFIIISSFLLLSILIFFALHKNKAVEAKIEQDFWDKEHRANSTRKKSLNNLNYITIPSELTGMTPTNANEEIDYLISNLVSLSENKIVNLTGYSNTDLKLEYGTANITILSEYDFNYTNLVTLLQKLAEKLYEAEEKQLAIKTLEFAVETGTDVSKSYYLLAKLYTECNTPDKISHLINQAQNLNSLLKNTIVQNLQAGNL